MAADVQWSGEGVTFRVEGLRRTVRALQAAGADAEDLKSLMHQIGSVVATAAQTRAPVGTDSHSGRLKGTIRAGRGKTKAVVRAGGARAPYAGVIHYGWPKRNIAPQPFLVDALQAERSQVFHDLDEGLAQLLREHHLR